MEGNEHVKLHVDVTPDGHGDTIREVDGERMFVMPASKEMRLDEFRDGLRKQQQMMMMMMKRKSSTKRSNNIERDENGLQSFSKVNNYAAADDDINVNADSNDNVDDNVNANDNDNADGTQDCEEILYYSRQNDCLRSELQPLTALFPPTISFAEEALNLKPDAVNLWIGNEASVSSMHKDHYENIMCVTSGEKVFTICPPSDAIYLKEASFPSGTFEKQDKDDIISTQHSHAHDHSHSHAHARSQIRSSGAWRVGGEGGEDEEGKHVQMVRWIESDVERLLPPFSETEQQRQSYLERNPLLQHAHPMRIHVKAGDMLYLPSLWYHRVTQTCETVAVNYWYDMRFDSPGWCAFNFFQHMNDENSTTCRQLPS